MPDRPAATVNHPADLAAELDKLAEATGRSPSELAERALAECLDVRRAQIEGVHAALRDPEAGRPDLSHEEVCARALERHRGAGVTERLGAIYGPEPELSDLDPVLRALQGRSVAKDRW